MWYLVSFVCGVVFGWIFYRYQKSFYGSLLAMLPFGLVAAIRLYPFVPLMDKLPSKLPQHEPGEHTVASALVDIIFTGSEFYILIFMISFFVGRIMAWVFYLTLAET